MSAFNKEKLDQIEARANQPSKMAREKIMIVDDEEANRAVMTAILKSHYDILEANDGQDALRQIERLKGCEPIACIISDHRMPNLTGVELLERARFLTPHTIRIIVTGFVDVDVIIDSINKSEIYKYIVKPFDANDFLLTVHRAVESFQLQQKLHRHQKELEQKIRIQEKLISRNNQLQKSMAETFALYNNASCGYHSLDPNGIFIQINDTELKWLGKAREELVGKVAFLDLATKNSLDVLYQKFPLLKTQGWVEDTNDVELEIVAKDGAIIPILFSSTTTISTESNERVTRFTVFDFTERKRLEEGVRKTLAERDIVLENSIVGIVFLNAQGRVQWANRAMTEMFGINEANHFGKSLEPHYPSRAEYLKIGSEVSAAVRKGIAYEAELRMLRADGSPFWAYLSGRAVDPQNPARGTVWVVMDTTKRRNLEEDFYKSEEHHRQIINNVTEGILVVQDGRIVFANPRVGTLTGYNMAELYTVPFIEGIHPEDKPLVIDNHIRRLRGEQVEQYYRFRILNKVTGAIVWVELSAVMIEWENQPATLSFITDITERRQLEESLRESLAERIRLETLQLHQHELKDAELARHHAEKAMRAKSQFLAVASHDLRQPTHALGLFIATLRTLTQKPEIKREDVENIVGRLEESLKTLGQLLNALLDVSRLDAGVVTVEKKSFSLQDTLTKIYNEFSGHAQSKNIKLIVVPTLLWADTDPVMLHRILSNLVSNAIRYTHQGRILVGCRRKQNAVEIQVWDTGVGIAEEQLPKIFQEFYQVHNISRDREQGLGLGLAIVQRLADLLGARLDVSSVLNKGSAFSIRIPRATTQKTTKIKQQEPIESKKESKIVLIIDDDPEVLDAANQLLVAWGHVVIPAMTMDQALSAASKHASTIGMILADYRLAENVNGADVIRAVISQLGRTVPAVIITGDTSIERIREANASGFELLHKPLEAKRFRQLIDKY